jgi:hypothetical protein
VDTFLQYWTVTIFMPSLLLALAILIMIIRATDKG